jgi:hypothetical protein
MTNKKTGFSDNPNVEFLYFRCRPYHETIPDRFFNGEYAYVLEPYSFTDRNGNIHTAKRGLIIDGGSLPHLGFVLKWISTPYRLYLLAYGIHDQECKDARDIASMAKDRDNDKELMKLSRRKRANADDTLVEMLAWINDNIPLIKCSKVKRGLMWLGVRLGAIGSIVLGTEHKGREDIFREKQNATEENNT